MKREKGKPNQVAVIFAGVFLGVLVRGAEWNSAGVDSAATSVRVSDPIRAPAAVLREFSMLRRRQMELDAEARGVKIAPEHVEVFNSVNAGDWARTERLFQVCVRGVGWQPGSNHDPHFDKTLWEYAKEAVGAAQEFLSWPPEVLEIYAQGILDVIPPRCHLLRRHRCRAIHDHGIPSSGPQGVLRSNAECAG